MKMSQVEAAVIMGASLITITLWFLAFALLGPEPEAINVNQIRIQVLMDRDQDLVEKAFRAWEEQRCKKTAALPAPGTHWGAWEEGLDGD